MYIPFRVSDITANSSNSSVTIYTTQEINKDSINASTIEIYEKSSRDFLELNFDVEGKKLNVFLKNPPLTGEEYIVKISDIENILGEKIESNVRRRFVFEGEPVGKVEIISPVEYEDIDTLNLLWKELPVKEYINRYRIQIAQDLGFNRLVVDEVIKEKNSYATSILEQGQYFVRIRIEAENSIGAFSDIRTFSIKDFSSDSDSCKCDNDMTPIIEEDFFVTSMSKNGETPEYFVFEFSSEIELINKQNITVKSKNVPLFHTVKAYENILEIHLEEIKDNEVYEFCLDGIVSRYKEEDLIDKKFSIQTALKPFYSSVYAVRSLTESYDATEEIIRFHIRETSRYVDYLIGAEPDTDDLIFASEQFVKYKTAHECVLRLYIDKSSFLGSSGRLGDVEFNNSGKFGDIEKLLKYLAGEAEKWEKILLGYDTNTARPSSTVRGAKSSPHFTNLRLNYSRGV